jgi:hypothetical protein
MDVDDRVAARAKLIMEFYCDWAGLPRLPMQAEIPGGSTGCQLSGVAFCEQCFQRALDGGNADIGEGCSISALRKGVRLRSRMSVTRFSVVNEAVCLKLFDPFNA